MTDAAAELAIARGLRVGGFIRRHRPLGGRAKEWLHFCIATPELCALINFSLSELPEQGEVARITCIVFDGAWHGDVETIDPTRVRVRAGRIDLAFAGSHVRLSADGALLVRVEMPRRKLEIDLTFRPRAYPLLVNNVHVGEGALIHWFVLPRLAASGYIAAGDQRHEVHELPAYHDHNWGTFGWGGDFAWVWGFAHPVAGHSPWSVTFDRFMNRRRTADRARALLVWKDGLEHRLFRDQDVAIELHGALKGEPKLRVPRAMALALEGSAFDVPERIVVQARGRNDRIELEACCEDACQIIVPDDTGTGVTTITEARCRIAMHGRIRGEAVELAGTGVFEFLGG